MKTVIVFESMFGNTELLARAIADEQAAVGATPIVVEASAVGAEEVRGCDLLVVGAPTHAFSLSRASTRRDAVNKGADPGRAALGVRDWLGALGRAIPIAERPPVAVFDTRVEKARRLPGSAARRAARMLRDQGFVIVDRPMSFYVVDLTGPVAPGEVERARSWAARLGGFEDRGTRSLG